jgi:Mg-chelatase subunit ChlI
MNVPKVEKNHTAQVMVHDINASISALQGAMEVITDEWRTNPELVEKILPLTLEKINQLQMQLANYHTAQQKIPSSKK